MIRSLPGWFISLLIILAVAGGLGWWVYSVTLTPPIVTPPAVSSSKSPLSSPVIDGLRTRTIYGDLPLKDTSPIDRADPFLAQ